MTIQLSVTVWTVICFCLLMLILHNLLFKPVLKVMDDRRERIEKARLKKEEQKKLEEEQKLLLEEKEKAFAEANKKQVKEQVTAIRAEYKSAVEEAQDERIRLVDDYRIKAEEEHCEILRTLSVHSNELALYFAESLIKE